MQSGRNKFDKGYGKNEKRRGGKMKRTIVRHRLAERTIHRIAVERCLAVRMGDDLGNRDRGRAVDVGLGDVGLQGKGDQKQADDKAPA